MEKKINVKSLQETKELAEKAAGVLQGKTYVITLDGDLGAGKTTWTKAFGKALGVKNTINSPTFTIMKSYRQADGRPLYHIDAYRLEGADQDLGFDECFDEGITVVEWSSFIEDQLPEARLNISIEEGVDEERTFTLSGEDETALAVMEVLA